MKSNAKKVKLTSVDDLFSTEESPQDAALEKVQRIALSELYPFPDHPFSVKDDDSMKETVESIRERGVLQPVLEELRKEWGLTLEQLDKQIGLSKSALGDYEINSDKDIGRHAIISLAKFYGVTSDYLLGLSDMENLPNADLNDLHLSDEMIELLKNGKINNRLLCELAKHEGFQRFMVDLEIYVDRITNMRIHDVNAMLKVERGAVMECLDLDNNDLNMRTLELA